MLPSISSLSSESESSEVPSIKWHELHCDPILDIVLLSKDGVHFRASSHALKRESSLFDGMLSITPNPHQTPSNPIALDFNADVIALFLDHYAAPTHDHYSTYGKLSLPFLRDYEVLIRYLDCDRFLAKAEKAHLSSRQDDPVAWLVMANDDDDIASAKLALARCRERNTPISTADVFALIDRMRATWRYPLVKCLLIERGLGKGQHFGASWPGEMELSAFEARVEVLEGVDQPQ